MTKAHQNYNYMLQRMARYKYITDLMKMSRDVDGKTLKWTPERMREKTEPVYKVKRGRD